MRLAGSKTQILVLSQKHQDARDFTIKVNGTPVAGTRHLLYLLTAESLHHRRTGSRDAAKPLQLLASAELHSGSSVTACRKPSDRPAPAVDR